MGVWGSKSFWAEFIKEVQKAEMLKKSEPLEAGGKQVGIVVRGSETEGEV